jgi:aspartyl aminopeptidase
MITKLTDYLNESYTAFHAVANAKKLLLENGFSALSERSDWKIEKGGKYFLERNGSALIAFTVGNTDNLTFKIIASHTDSPALKIKENPLMKAESCVKLNVEKYGGGILYSFLDKPLKIAGRVTVEMDGKLITYPVASDYSLLIPSQAIHINRAVNDGAALNAQVDMCPLFALAESENAQDFYKTLTTETVLGSDLYVVNGEKTYSFGANGEFVAGPRVDNLSSAYSSLTALVENEDANSVCVAALFDNQEVGNQTAQGSASDFLENVLKRISYVFGKNEQEYLQSLAKSFLLSLDVAHAAHPNHPEKCDPTNRTALGGGIAIKYNANTSYVTDGKSSAVIKSIFNKANVAYQTYYCRSDMPCGSTLGRSFISRVGMLAVDVGLPQLAMHSACECFAKKDYISLVNGLKAFFATKISINDEAITIQ